MTDLSVGRVVLKAGKEKPVLGFHPWIFSGAIEKLPSGVEPGSVVDVSTQSGKFLARGYFNPRSQITVRILTFQDEPLDENFFRKRLERAIALREPLARSGVTNAYRLVNSEGDGLPGLVVDRYGDFLSARFLTLGLWRFKSVVVKLLGALLEPKGIYERPDESVAALEGIRTTPGRLSGDEPPELVEIRENDHVFNVDVRAGQKSGFYLDQRENRAWLAPFAQGRSVLSCFCYSGAFSVYLARAGATRVVSVDASQPALELAERHFRANRLDPAAHAFVRADAFQFLRAQEELFDLAILDPPAFCKSKAQLSRAARGYKDLHLHAMKRVRPGGLLFAASCSHFISADLFGKILFSAAKDVRRAVEVLGVRGHPLDHPVSIFHPEGNYLKAFLVRVGEVL